MRCWGLCPRRGTDTGHPSEAASSSAYGCLTGFHSRGSSKHENRLAVTTVNIKDKHKVTSTKNAKITQKNETYHMINVSYLGDNIAVGKQQHMCSR